MKQIPLSLLFCLSLAVAVTGCGGKKDPATELQKAPNTMSEGEAPPAATAQPAQAAPAAQPAAELTSQTAGPPPAQQMQQALASYKAGNLEDAVTRLQKLRATAALSPEQRMSLQDAVAAVMGEVYTMAAKGDTRAIAAVKQYEQMQTRPR